ncbi:MAG: hypothetical protein ACLFRL_05465 [Desulfohalobiaceae bacterium]
MPEEKTEHYLDIKLGPNQYRRYYFKSEQEKRQWQRMHKKSKLYIPYFLLGICINFGLYFSGLDLSSNVVLGGAVGLGVPLVSMYFLSELHFRIWYRSRQESE